jgi:hypothetical protein
VRVTNNDQQTFGEYSVLAVISASGNIGGWTDVTAAQLPQATMRHGAAAAQVSQAARTLYVVGGDGGGATPTRLDVTQIAVLDRFGNIGRWLVGHNRLPAGRTQLQLVAVPSSTGAGGAIYAIGGNTAAGTDNVVLRAKVLLPSEAPAITRGRVTLGGTLPRGTFYYRVSAVLDGTDATNPNGETLPSEELVAHTVPDSKVILEWSAVSKAAKYRVYRTATVNGTSKDDVLLADNVTATTFTDDGTATPGSDRPFALGELGVWVPVASLVQPRRSHGAALAHDSAGTAYLYAIGGDKGTSFALDTAATDIYDTYEVATLSDDGMTLGAWTEDTTNRLASKRTRLQSPVGEHATSPAVTAPANYVYAVGGWSGSAIVDNYEAGTLVQPGGSTPAGRLVWSTGATSNKIWQALTSIVANNFLFAFGGLDRTGVVQQMTASNGYTTPPVFGATLNANTAAATDVAMTQKIAAQAALTRSSAHLWLLGGTVDGTTALRRVWSNIY